MFSYEALEELNFKAKNFKDLLDDTPFTKNDVIVIQDPRNTTKFNLSSFHHVKNDLKVEDEEDVKKAKTDPRARMRKVNPETKSTLEELDKTYEPDMTKNIHPEREKVHEKADKFNAATWSTGMRGASLTSTAFARVLEMDHAILDESAVKYERVKKKGYVRLQTNMGPINLELHCDIAKKTCENFLKHCQSGYYTGTIFHRYIFANLKKCRISSFHPGVSDTLCFRGVIQLEQVEYHVYMYLFVCNEAVSLERKKQKQSVPHDL